MSDKSHPYQTSTLINPTVRNYMDTLSLERFYGGYVLDPLPEGIYNLGIGEVGNIPLKEDLYEVYGRFVSNGELSRLALRYSGTMGEKETNGLVADWLNRWLHVDRFHRDVVVSTDGGQNAMSVAVRTVTSPLGSADSEKQYVLLAAPTYPYMSAVVGARAGVMAFLAYDSEQFTRGVETYCNPSVGLILVNAPHNPMGYSLTAEQVARINRVAATYDCAILVDMVYATYAADPAVGAALGGFDPDRTIYADSFSKKYGFAGMRLGFAVSAVESLTYAMRFLKTSESLVPSMVKLAFAGHLLANHRDDPTTIADEVRARHHRFLAAFAPEPELQVRPYGGQPNAFYLALNVAELAARTGLTDAAITGLLLERYNVKVYPGAFVYPNPALNHATFAQAGRPSTAGDLPFQPPAFPKGAQVVYAPDFFEARAPLLRLSFGVETRIEPAAQALAAALADIAHQGESLAKAAGSGRTNFL